MKRKFSLTGWALRQGLGSAAVGFLALGAVSLCGCGGSDSSTTVASNTAASPTGTMPTPGAAPTPTSGGPTPGAKMGPIDDSGSSEGSSSGGYSGGGSSAGDSSGGGVMNASLDSMDEGSEGMANSGGGGEGLSAQRFGASDSSGDSSGSSSAGMIGAPYGPGGPTGDRPSASGGPTPGDMANYNSSGGKGSSGGLGSMQSPGMAPLDGEDGSDGMIGAPSGMRPSAIGGPGGSVPQGFGQPGLGQPGFGQPGSAPSGPQKPAEDAPYLEKAKYAFSIGREPDAYKFAIAHAISGAEDANAVLDEIRWVKDLASPNSGITVALGMELKAPAGLTDYKPIGSADQNLGGPGRMGGGEPGMMGSGFGGMGGGGSAPGKKDDPATFTKATGEMGRAFIRMFEERFMEGKFGKLFTETENHAGSINAAPQTGGQGGFGDGGSDMMSSMSEGGSGMAAGRFGPGAGMPGAGPGAPGAPGARKSTSTGARLTPGLSYIGTGSLVDLKSKATKDGFDCLVVFDVQVEQNKRTGRISNDTRVMLVSLKTGKIIAPSKKLNNIEVQKRMEDGQGDGIEAALQLVFNKMDEFVALSEMPTLKPEVVQKRISDLANSKQVPTLKALGEVSLFHHLKLINDEERTSAFELLLEGADGNTLGTGSEEEKRAVIDKLMPKL